MRKAYKLEAFSAIFVGVFSGCILPYYLVVAREHLHASSFMISLMVAAPFLGNIFSLFWANAMEGRPKMPFAANSFFFARAMFFLMLFAFNPTIFTVIVCVSMFLGTVASPAYAAIMKDIYPDAYRGRIMGYIRVMLAAAMIVTTLIVGKIISKESYRWIFATGSVFGITSAHIFGKIETSDPTNDEIHGKRSTWLFLCSSFQILSEDKSFRWFALSVLTFGFGTLIVAPIYPIFQADRLHITGLQLAIISAVTYISWMLAYYFWGRYIDHRSPLRASVLNVVMATIVPMNYILVSFYPSAWLLLPSAVLIGVSNAGIELAYFNAVLRFAGDGTRTPHYQALFSCLLGIRGSIAPFAGAALMESLGSKAGGFNQLFIIATGVMCLGTIMQIIGMRREIST